MKRFFRGGLLLALAATCGCRADTKPAATAEPAKQASHDIDRASMDTSVAPGNDFFRYANGTWLKTTAIPPDRGSYGIWSMPFDQSQQRTKALLEKAAAGNAAAGSDERKAGDYFASYMDDATIEKRGLAPLRPDLDTINAIADRQMLARWIGQSLRADVDPLNATNFYTRETLSTSRPHPRSSSLSTRVTSRSLTRTSMANSRWAKTLRTSPDCPRLTTRTARWATRRPTAIAPSSSALARRGRASRASRSRVSCC